MNTRLLSLLPVLALAALLAGCEKKDPGERQPSKAESAGAAMSSGAASSVEVPGERHAKRCEGLPDKDALQGLLDEAPKKGEAGGFLHGKNQWAAVVNREGEVCAVAVAVTDKPQVPDKAAAWPGSKAIAKAKAFTANAFSNDATPMSTARLYTMSLPGHSLWGAANGNPFNPKCLTAPSDRDELHIVCGGTITFGGGLPLYKGKTRIGGLGVSGDTPCADHEIAKIVRDSAGLNPEGGKLADDIVYAGVDPPSIYAHPLCTNTWRNGALLGNEGATLDASGLARAVPSLATPASGVKVARPASAASATR
jgi:uncharacterized protein GlcG (DUF336 family)